MAVTSFALDSKFPMFLTWGDQLACVYNDAYSELLGNKHPWALGRPFEEVWPDIWNDVHPFVQRALSGESVYLENLPLTMHRKGYDEEVWFTFTYSPVRDDRGMVRGMCCTCVETTQQVLTERRREEEFERLRDLFQQAPGMMAVLRGPRHVFELVNEAYIHLVGERRQIGMPVREALPELEGQGFFELLDKVYATGKPYVGRAVPITLRRNEDGTLDERFVDFIYQPIRDERGNVSGIFLEGSDVTEAVRANMALRDSEERLRQLANTIPHLAWMANPDGYVHWYNDRWYEFTGTTLQGVEGWNWTNLFDAEDLSQMLVKWRHAISTGTPYDVTTSMRSATGERRTFYVTAAPLRDAAGKIVQWFGTNTDVTDIQRAQEELKAANRRKDDFLAMLAHELRNPLAPISTAAELLKLAGLDKDRIRQTGEVITRQVAHMTELVDDLLDVSRVTRGLIKLKEEVLDIENIIADAVEQVHSLIEAKHQYFVLDVPDRVLTVKGDRTRLTQVLTNILNNAAKYTPEYGNISLHLAPRGRQIDVTIRDDGIGIAPELLPHLFELFTQAERTPDRSQGGLGLGLALVRSLVELHGGTVSATSPGPGKGSEFTIRLPLLESGVAEHDDRAVAADANLSRNARQCLVVDDNIDAAHTLALMLETLGHRVAVEYHPAKALEAAGRVVPEVFILDIGLPEMDGYELARRLRAMPQLAGALLIAVSGYGQQEDKDRALQSGFDHHLTKPIRLDDLLCLIN